MPNKMNPVLRSFWTQKYLADKTPIRYRVLYGGRASSKSWDASGRAIFIASQAKVKVLCGRQFQNKISESVYTLLVKTIERFGMTSEFKITDTSIKHKITGSEFIFLGLWRNIDEIKSLEDIDILWLEEAHALTKEQWDIIDPTIRKQGSEIWVIFNPRSRLDFGWKRFVEKPLASSIIRKINYDENPFLSETMKQVIAQAKIDDPENFDNIYLGYPNESSETALFTFKDVERAMNRNGDASGTTVIGCDVARFGDDSSVLATRSGMWVKSILKRNKLRITETADWASRISTLFQADAIIVDTIGMGVGVHDILIKKGEFAIDGNFGMKPSNPDVYYNKRAESYARLAEAVKKGLSLPHDDELAEELLAIEYKFNEAGRMQIEPKDKLKDRLGRSPDKADAVALTFFTDIASRSKEENARIDSYVAPNVF